MYRINTSADKPNAERLKNNVSDMMKHGIRVGNILTAYNFFSEIAETMAIRLKSEFGIDNPNSPKQIEYFLSNRKDPIYYEICYQEGKWTSNKEALEELKSHGIEFADVLMKYRKAKKLTDSVKALLNAKDNNGLIHPTVSLTKTNRISYTAPALMNIPKKLLWDVITPYKDGDFLWSADIKNQEPSILINIVGADSLKHALTSPDGLYECLYSECFKPRAKCTLLVMPNAETRVIPREELMNNPKIPPATYAPVPTDCPMDYCGQVVRYVDTIIMQTGVNNMPELPSRIKVYTEDNVEMLADVVWDEIKAKDLSKPQKVEVYGTLTKVKPMCVGVYRKEFKTSWNAMTYGSSKRGIVAQCKHIDGDKVYRFFHDIPQLKYYQSVWTKQAKIGVQYSKTLFGTLLHTDEYDTKRLARSLMDLPIQGTGADILDLLVAHFIEETNKRGISDKIWIYYTRHDEVILEVDGDWQREVGADYVESVIRDILEHQINDWEPFKIEVSQLNSDLMALLSDENFDD